VYNESKLSANVGPTLSVAYLGGFIGGGDSAMPPHTVHPINFSRRIYRHSVWTSGASCCMHINFKTVFQSASQHSAFTQNIENISGEAAQPSP